MSEQEMDAREGFEFDGRFYRWHLSDMGKDLMLIDRISGMGISAFFEVAEETVAIEDVRTPVLLTLIATSIRHGHPSWSVDRVYRTVMDLNLSDVTIIGSTDDEETTDEDPTRPPAIEGRSRSTSNGSSPSSTPADGSTSETSSETPQSSTNPGSPTTSPA